MTIASTDQGAQAGGWLLVIDDPVVRPDATSRVIAGPGQRILGLSVLLRLALTGQAAGARAVALAETPYQAEARRRLADRRLRIPVIDEADRPSLIEFRIVTPSVRVPANTVIHRATLVALAESATLLSGAPTDAGGPYGFEPIFVDSIESAREAQRALLRSLRKP
jgi:hypothetical protein